MKEALGFFIMVVAVALLATSVVYGLGYLIGGLEEKRCAEKGEVMGLYTEWRPDLRECYVNYKGRKMPLDWLKNKWNY